MKLLADTSAILALVLREDENHPRAAEFLRRSPRVRFVITELILAEVVTRVRARVGAPRAVDLANELLRSRRFDLIFLDEETLRGGLAQMARFADKVLSFADGTSFEVMHRLGLEAAFTFDKDFRDCGFPMLP